MNKVIEQDIRRFVEAFPFRERLRNTSFLITGATGLIGTALIRCLSALDVNIRIYAPVRNIKKAQELFADYPNVILAEGDLNAFDYSKFEEVDYIIHGAAPTASKFFVEKPVETINSIFIPTNNLLQYAKENEIKGFVFLSSLEIYGDVLEKKKISEDIQGEIDILAIRSSYPLAKRVAENLCEAFSFEYGVPVKIARLTQTTGAGISRDDNRIIAQFVRNAVNNKDIILHTSGLSARPYCYLTDAVAAILYILLLGKNGEAYNIANESTYVSARELAQKVIKLINPELNVRIELNNEMGYAPTSYLDLSTVKLKSLGWNPQYSLDSIILSLKEYLSKR